MFQWLEKRLKERLEKRRKEQEEKSRKEHPEWFEVSFCLQDVEFMDYGLPFNLTACGNELSLYEADEKSFHEEVNLIFREITEELTEGFCVLQWLHWSSAKPMSAIIKYRAGERAFFDEHIIIKCTESGADDVLLEMQMAEEHAWEFIEQECYCYRDKIKSLATVEAATEYIEEVPCDLYIIMDLMHGALMVKTRKEEDLKIVENCMRRVCAKYEKKIYDYIGQ